MRPRADLFTAALGYAARGGSVIPLRGDKKPALGKGEIDRYRVTPADEAQLRAWFVEGTVKWGPVAGIGIICGAVSGGLVVRDFDTMEGYEAWAKARPDLAATLPTVATARGRHVYFHGDAVKVEKQNDGELRGAGYVCAPPTRHPSGAYYRWLVPLPAGELPTIDPVAAGLVTVKPAKVKAATPAARLATGAGGAEGLLARALAEAQEGSRHDRGVWLACQLRDSRMDEGEAEGIMRRFAAGVPRGESPYTESEALATLQGILATPPRAKPIRAGSSALPAWILALRPKPYRRVLLERIAEQCRAQPIDAAGSLGYCIAGYEKLADLANVCDRTAKRWIKAMVAEGTVVKVNHGGWERETGEAVANVYAIPGEFEALEGVRDEGIGTPQRFSADRVTQSHTKRRSYVVGQSVTLSPAQTNAPDSPNVDNAHATNGNAAPRPALASGRLPSRPARRCPKGRPP